jgi:hypothetical protein
MTLPKHPSFSFPTRPSPFFPFYFFILFFLACPSAPTPPKEDDCRPASPTDTTSHNFIWRLDTLGDGNGSELNAVCVINDTLAYAVGEIYLKDSLGQIDPSAYNVAKWDGKKWELLRIQFYTFCNQAHTSSYPGTAVWAFGANEVWVASYSQIAIWNGSSQTGLTCLPVSVSKIWATSNSNVYTAGPVGNLGFYNGTTWQKLSSGTTLDIFDIYGAENCRGETEILAVASNFINVPQGKKLLLISGTTVSSVSDDGLPLAISGTWFAPRQSYYVVGDGVYRADALGGPWRLDSGHPLVYKFCIRGLAVNDIVIGGSFGLIIHFNGSTWRHFTGSEVPSFFGSFTSVAIHSRLVVAVGDYENGKAVALVGRR